MRKTQLLSLIYEGQRNLKRYEDAMTRKKLTDRDYPSLIAETKQEIKKLKTIYATANDLNR